MLRDRFSYKNVLKDWFSNEVTPVQEIDENADEDNESQPKKTKKKLGIDRFNNLETDPKESGAMSKYLTFPFSSLLIYFFFFFFHAFGIEFHRLCRGSMIHLNFPDCGFLA